MYVGAILPDGRFASWVGTPQAPTVVIGAAPLPPIVDVNLLEKSETAVRVEFTATEPTGLYLLYGIVVKTGGTPFDPASWISAHFYPGENPRCSALSRGQTVRAVHRRAKRAHS